MRSYFHCSTARLHRRRTAVLILSGSVCAESAVISFVVMFFALFGADGSVDRSLARAMLLTAAAFVTAGLVICFAAASSLDKRAARHSRYTYLDIQLRSAVISVYSGETEVFGENAVFREIYLIPFGDFISAAPSRNGKKLVIRGKIRRYGMKSDLLGYHVRNGDIEFDRMWLNHGAYKELGQVSLPAYFGSPAKISEALLEAKKRFDEIPKPKKHEFREADFIRRRPKRRILPDDMSFSRNWK